MIIYALINVLVWILSVFTIWFPVVTQLPFGLDSYFQSAFSVIYVLAEYFPPLQTVITAFIIYIGFRILLFIVKILPFIGKGFNHI